MRIGKTVIEIRISKIHFVGVKLKLCGVCRKMYRDLGLTPKSFLEVLDMYSNENMGNVVHLRWTQTDPQSQDY